MKKTLIALSFLLCFHVPAHAYFISTMSVTGGAGTMSNKDETIPKLNMAYGEAALELGYKFGMIAPLIQGSYRYVDQTTKEETAGELNMTGNGYTVGAGFAFEFERISLSLIYDFSGKYNLTKENSSGTKVSYSKAVGGHASIKYLMTKNWVFVISGSYIDYKEKIVDAEKTDISENPLNQTLYGLGFGYRF